MITLKKLEAILSTENVPDFLLIGYLIKKGFKVVLHHELSLKYVKDADLIHEMMQRGYDVVRENTPPPKKSTLHPFDMSIQRFTSIEALNHYCADLMIKGEFSPEEIEEFARLFTEKYFTDGQK